MDPDLFRIDWEVLLELLVTIIVLSFFVERVLSLLFESNFYVTRFKDSGFKEPIALAFSYLAVHAWGFDALGILFKADKPTILGYFITAGIIAGGSKASIKLFHDLLGVKGGALKAAPSAAKPPTS